MALCINGVTTAVLFRRGTRAVIFMRELCEEQREITEYNLDKSTSALLGFELCPIGRHINGNICRWGILDGEQQCLIGEIWQIA